MDDGSLGSPAHDATGTEATLAGEDYGGRDPGRSPLGSGDTVGRYVVLRKIGAGAMGVVYAAYDPDLDRKVAVKLLHRSNDPGDETDTGRARLLQEGQALAKLSHPNVVAVHDVGTVDGRSWVAMEFVLGETLGTWAAAAERSWEEVVSVMRRAAGGLAAAHRAGILHRDFKPDNVMVGTDGRVRVMDFGLARSAQLETPVEADGSTPAAGAIVGTPAYMAPEQFLGEPATPASDQFSYCATLWELLYGERAFDGDSIHALAAAVIEGRRRPAPSGRSARAIPSWLRRLCERGLSKQVEARHESMQALVDGFALGRRRARLVRAGAMVALVAVATGAGVGYRTWDEHRRIDACRAEGRTIKSVWNSEVEAEIRNAMHATGVAYADTSADRAVPWLDDHATQWQDTMTRACLEYRVNGTWSADRHERASWCLDERNIELATVINELERPDTQIVRRATSAVTGLGAIEACMDERLPSTPPPADRDALRQLRVELARASAMEFAGRYADALALTRDVRARADGLRWPPVSAAAQTLEGRLLERMGAYEEAERTLTAAFTEAARHGVWEVAKDAAKRLGFTVGHRAGRWKDAVMWAEMQRVATTQAGDFTGLGRAEYLASRAAALMGLREFEEASRLFAEAQRAFEKRLGTDHSRVGGNLNNYAASRYRLGEVEEAGELWQRALAIKERFHGPEHPDLTGTIGNLAVVNNRLGRLDDAVALHRRALEIGERALGPDHSDVGTTLHNLGNVYARQGRAEEAKVSHTRALAIRTSTLPPSHPEVGASASALAVDHFALGEFEPARELYLRALDVNRARAGPDDIVNGVMLYGLAECATGLGDDDDAREYFAAAAAVFDAHPGESPDEPAFRFAHAEHLLARGESAAAIRAAEAARAGYSALANDDAVSRVDAWLASRNR